MAKNKGIYRHVFYDDAGGQTRVRIEHPNGNYLFESTEGYSRQSKVETALDNYHTAVREGRIEKIKVLGTPAPRVVKKKATKKDRPTDPPSFVTEVKQAVLRDRPSIAGQE